MMEGAEKQTMATIEVNQIPLLNPAFALSSPTTQAPIQQTIRAITAIGAATLSNPVCTLLVKNEANLSNGFI
jgi:hypothetical protein